MWELRGKKSVSSCRKFTGTTEPAPSQPKPEIKEKGKESGIAADNSLVIQGIAGPMTPFVI